ncbi:MAG: hypothetical protein Q7J84_03975 [Sulfuricaulis sp.]|nr:hypothetical protein [Sulfuricaulis sp.]
MQSVLDYRNAKAAIDLFNQGRKGAEEMQKHPELGQLLVEMHRAQETTLTVEDLMSDMEKRDDG